MTGDLQPASAGPTDAELATEAAMTAAYERQVADHQRSSLVAAANAGDAVAELLRFHMEGAVCNWPFGDAEPVGKLAEALLRTARIESEVLECQPSAAEHRTSLGQLAAACVKFLDETSAGAPVDMPGQFDDIPEKELPY